MKIYKYPQFDKNCRLKFHDDRLKVIVLTDKKGASKYRAENIHQKRVTAFRVDDCLIKNNDTKKCDYLLIVCEDNHCKNEHAYFIELKGGDLREAIKQIDRAFDLLEDKLKGIQKISARVSLSKFDVPGLKNDTTYIRLSDKLKKRGGDLKYKVKLEEQI